MVLLREIAHVRDDVGHISRTKLRKVTDERSPVTLVGQLRRCHHILALRQEVENRYRERVSDAPQHDRSGQQPRILNPRDVRARYASLPSHVLLGEVALLAQFAELPPDGQLTRRLAARLRSEEHTSELQSRFGIS